ncbi:ACP phosphodiesterase [Lutimonas sp.]|uniref:acyl carrier protein phosphodiesterase n=1 Tax=Lutimonas sp. TaxID=1872403 RepID=UPI003D9B0B44
MNYLAHIYLSQDHEMITIGNFMADHIKGNKYKKFPAELQKGILLHRQIDSFTDTHEIVKISKRRLNDRYGLYRGVVIDIFYDHFLAKNWQDYSEIPLSEYTQNFYAILNKNFDYLPDKIQHMSTYLIRDNWLLSYARLEGIQSVLEGMNRRTKNRGQIDMAIYDLESNYKDFKNDFVLFFDDLVSFSNKKLKEINETYDSL